MYCSSNKIYVMSKMYCSSNKIYVMSKMYCSSNEIYVMSKMYVIIYVALYLAKFKNLLAR